MNKPLKIIILVVTTSTLNSTVAADLMDQALNLQKSPSNKDFSVEDSVVAVSQQALVQNTSRFESVESALATKYSSTSHPPYNSYNENKSAPSKPNNQGFDILEDTVRSGTTHEFDYRYIKFQCGNGKIKELSKYLTGTRLTWNTGNGIGLTTSTGYQDLGDAIKYVCD